MWPVPCQDLGSRMKTASHNYAWTLCSNNGLTQKTCAYAYNYYIATLHLLCNVYMQLAYYEMM